jgi:hypothetical protein
LDMGNHCSHSLDCSLVSGSICIDPYFIHSYETVKKNTKDPTEIGPNWLLKQARDHASDSTENFLYIDCILLCSVLICWFDHHHIYCASGQISKWWELSLV